MVYEEIVGWMETGGDFVKIGYYAIFGDSEWESSQGKYGISIRFPDIPEAVTCARDDQEGYSMALDVLQLSLLRDDGSWPNEKTLPVPTPLENMELGQHEKAVWISFETQDVDMSKFQFFHDST